MRLKEVIRRLRVCPNTVIKYRKLGILKATLDESGAYDYDPKSVTFFSHYKKKYLQKMANQRRRAAAAKKKKKKYKRKRGPKKKPGPKKKVVRTTLPYVYRKKPYQVIITQHGKQQEMVKFFPDLKDARELFNKMAEEAAKIVFPKLVNNTYQKTLEPSNYEIYLIQRHDDPDDYDTTTFLRDDSGELVEYATNNKKWSVIDKAKYAYPETFYVYGYNPHNQRKTFEWIFDEFIAKEAHDKYKYKRVHIYLNKFIVECLGDMNIVFCKNRDDAVRMYNLVEKWSIERKYKYIAFCGDIGTLGMAKRIEWIDKLCEFTGFNRTKIKRRSLRP